MADSVGPEFPVFDAHKELFLRISPVGRRMADGVISNPLPDALQQHKWLARCFVFLLAFNSSAGPEGSASGLLLPGVFHTGRDRRVCPLPRSNGADDVDLHCSGAGTSCPATNCHSFARLR